MSAAGVTGDRVPIARIAEAPAPYIQSGIDNEDGWLDRKAADQRLFVQINLFACLFLQRFGFSSNGKDFYICFAVFAASTAWLLARSSGEIRPRIAQLFLLVAFLFTFSTLVGLFFPREFAAISVSSLVGVILYNSVFVIGPGRPLIRDYSIDLFLRFSRIICVMGLVQYTLQFVGIRIFTLGKVLPFLSPILVETNYNTEGIVAWGSTLQRANGIVMLEPSNFSQMIAIAVLVDVFIRRRLLFVPLYALAYVLSFSGTGMLSLVLTLAIAAVVIPSQRKHVLLGIAGGVPLLFAFLVLFPAQADMLLVRLDEFTNPGSSAWLRYVEQARGWSYFSDGWRLLIGSGAGGFERSEIYVRGSTSAAIKLYADYGLLGLLAYTTYLISAVWNARLAILSVMMLVIYQFGGGNLMHPPTLVLMAMLCIWAPGAQVAAARQPSEPIP